MENRLVTLHSVRELQRDLGRSLVKKALVPGKNSVPNYILLEELFIELSNGDVIHIPEGFVWDLSSVPRFLWSLLPPDGDFEIATLIHDYLYKNSGCLPYSQKFADREMYTWSRALSGTTNKVSMRNADNLIRYLGVRAGGWTKYKKRPC